MTSSELLKLLRVRLFIRTQPERWGGDRRLLGSIACRPRFRLGGFDFDLIDVGLTAGRIRQLERPVEFDKRKGIFHGLARLAAPDEFLAARPEAPVVRGLKGGGLPTPRMAVE